MKKKLFLMLLYIIGYYLPYIVGLVFGVGIYSTIIHFDSLGQLALLYVMGYLFSLCFIVFILKRVETPWQGHLGMVYGMSLPLLFAPVYKRFDTGSLFLYGFTLPQILIAMVGVIIEIIFMYYYTYAYETQRQKVQVPRFMIVGLLFLVGPIFNTLIGFYYGEPLPMLPVFYGVK